MDSILRLAAIIVVVLFCAACLLAVYLIDPDPRPM
jgi:hypothetical protein